MLPLKNCNNIGDLRLRARSKLPSPMFHYIDGGADDEWTLRRNTEAFDDYQLMPNYLNDISHVDLSTTILGCGLTLPFLLSPTGMSRLFHHHKELGVSKAAAEAGTLYALSTMATTSLEDVAAASDGPKMFQIYILKDRELTKEFVQRCKASGYKALCLTVDTALAGNRERDAVYGMTMPPKINRNNFFSYAKSWEWLLNMALSPDFKLANVFHRVDALGQGAMGLIEYVNSQFDRSVTWDDVAWLAEQWDGPFVIKGMTTVSDARRAVEVGATAAMLSNHGGRQLDGVPAPIDTLMPIRDAVGDRLELILDGGIRRGTHIVKALAMGANACSIGRPYLYGLAAGGQAGVARAIEILKSEVERDLALLGCSSIAELRSDHISQLNMKMR